MKVDIVTLYTSNYYTVGFQSANKMREYAKLHAYGFTAFKCLLNEERHPSWSKIVALSMLLSNSKADWLMWCDIDTKFVSRRPIGEHLTIEDGADMFISRDSCGICAGVFGLRVGSEWSENFLAAVNFLGPVEKSKWTSVGSDPQVNKFEQSTIKGLMQLFPAVERKIAVVPDSIIQNPESSFSADALMYHYWMGGRVQEHVASLIADDSPWSASVLDKSRL